LEVFLRKYRYIFYGLASTELCCASQLEHSIETWDGRPTKRNPYRIPHALKPVVEEDIGDMLRKKAIEPSIYGVAVLFWCKRIQKMDVLNIDFV